MKSLETNKMVYIIHEADKMNTAAANTILKFLEEPEEVKEYKNYMKDLSDKKLNFLK